MGRVSRLLDLGSLVGRTGTRFVTDRLKVALGGVSETEAAEEVRQVVARLSQMKGVAMKAGQQLAMLAMHLDLPEEVQTTLSTLHNRAEPVAFPEIRRAIEGALGGRLEDHFASFEQTPLGTASLAQAHAAILPSGRAVVVKVLHAGVAEAVEADLLAFRTVMRMGKVLGNRNQKEVDAVVVEVEERLREELDYLQEAVNIETFARIFGGHPHIRVPTLVHDLCNERILTMDRIAGEPLEAFVQTADRQTRQAAGERLADWFFVGTFHHHTLHADPHPGNYLFDPEGRIGVVDFGCVKRFDPYFLSAYARTVLAALDGDRAGTLEGCVDLDVYDGKNREAGDAIWDFCEALVEPWRHGPSTIGPGEVDLVVRLRPAAERLWKIRTVRGAKDMVFLHRSLAGMYAITRRLEVRADWGATLRRHLRVAIDAARI